MADGSIQEIELGGQEVKPKVEQPETPVVDTAPQVNLVVGETAGNLSTEVPTLHESPKEKTRSYVARETASGLRYRGAKSRRELLLENAHIRSIGFRDEVTNLLTRNAFVHEVNKYIAQATRRNEGLGQFENYGAAILDIDDFKNFNDMYGHATGDLVLRVVADAWASSLRDSDISGRYGGDELAALITDIKQDQPRVIAEEIQNRVEKYIAEHLPESLKQKGVQIKTSVGVSYAGKGKDFNQTIKDADEMMYERKIDRKRRDSSQTSNINV